MQEQKPKPKQYLICQTCNGSGRRKFGVVCKECSGQGVELIYDGRVFYWGLQLGQVFVGLGMLRRKLQSLINLIALLFGIAGVVAFGWWYYSESLKFVEPGILVFWHIKHWLLLFFWLGVLAFMFIYYRLCEDKVFKKRVKKLDTKNDKTWFDPMISWQDLKKFKNLERINVVDGFSFRTIEIVEKAYLLARKLKHSQVGPLHLFFSLLNDQEVRTLFFRLNVNEEHLVDKIKNQLSDLETTNDHLRIGNELRQVLIESYLDSSALGQIRVKPINLILPILKYEKAVEEVLYEIEIDQDKIKNTVFWFRIHERLVENYKNYRRMARFKPSTNMDRAYTAIATPSLNAYSHDITLAAKWSRLEFCVSREREIEEIFKAIKSGRNGVMLVGEVGVGKRTIINGIAELMVKEEVPKILQDKRLVEVDISRLISGANPAEAQARLLEILDETARARNIVLYISNIETIVGITAGSEESLDLADVLVSHLEHYGLICLASVTQENYIKSIESTPLGEVMAKIEIDEPIDNQAIEIVESKVAYLESSHNVYFSYNALEAAVKFTSKYIHDKFLPAKAIEVLESLATKLSVNSKEAKLITKEDVAELMSEQTGIPMTKVGEQEGKDLLNLEEKIHEHMINQVEAVDMVAASLRRARAELSEGKRPIASFLFLGPTGVGKTELAKTVAKVYFGQEKCMIRIDMSEYQNQESLVKMIGDAENKGYLTEAVRRAPFSLLLLDEFEKAHPEILNLFLQVMDDGRLTDGQGRTIDFTNCIIIATSNAGAVFIEDQIKAGVDIETVKEALINDQLNKIMKPELINRFDGIIVFKPLSMEHVIQIAELMLKKTAKTLEKKGIRFTFNETGVKILAEAGFDPKFGARPLRRLLQDRVDNIVANKLLAGELKRRDAVMIDSNGEVQVQKAEEL